MSKLYSKTAATYLIDGNSYDMNMIRARHDDDTYEHAVVFGFDASLWPHLLEEAGSQVSLDSP